MAGMRRLVLHTMLFSWFVCATATAQADADGDTSRPGADAYTQRVQAGIALLVVGDNGGATRAFRDAIGMDGNRPMAPYYLAAASRLSGELDEALNGFRRAAELGQSEPRWRGRALQGIADTLERMEGRLEDARTAWQEYVRFADANSVVTFPQLGRARVSAIDLMLEQEHAYVQVRERIAERERENARGAPARPRPR